MIVLVLSWEQLVHSHLRFARMDSGYRKSMRQYTAGKRTLLPVGLQKVACVRQSRLINHKSYHAQVLKVHSRDMFGRLHY